MCVSLFSKKFVSLKHVSVGECFAVKVCAGDPFVAYGPVVRFQWKRA